MKIRWKGVQTFTSGSNPPSPDCDLEQASHWRTSQLLKSAYSPAWIMDNCQSLSLTFCLRPFVRRDPGKMDTHALKLHKISSTKVHDTLFICFGGWLASYVCIINPLDITGYCSSDMAAKLWEQCLFLPIWCSIQPWHWYLHNSVICATNN